MGAIVSSLSFDAEYDDQISLGAEPASGFHDPSYLRECLPFVGAEVDNPIEDHNIGPIVLDG